MAIINWNMFILVLKNYLFYGFKSLNLKNSFEKTKIQIACVFYRIFFYTCILHKKELKNIVFTNIYYWENQSWKVQFR